MRLVTAAAVVLASIEEVHPALCLVMLILYGGDGRFLGLLEVLLQKKTSIAGAVQVSVKD